MLGNCWLSHWGSSVTARLLQAELCCAGAQRQEELRNSPGLSWRQRRSPNPSRSSAELCSCFPALVLNIPCGVFSASTVPVCQASLLWPFFFFNQSPLSAFAPVGAFLFLFIWFPRHPAASSVVACLHHPKLCSFFHVFMAGICRANINPLVAHG